MPRDNIDIIPSQRFCRNLFGSPDREDTRKKARNIQLQIQENCRQRWNFDFSKDEPESGRYQWRAVACWRPVSTFPNPADLVTRVLLAGKPTLQMSPGAQDRDRKILDSVELEKDVQTGQIKMTVAPRTQTVEDVSVPKSLEKQTSTSELSQSEDTTDLCSKKNSDSDEKDTSSQETRIVESNQDTVAAADSEDRCDVQDTVNGESSSEESTTEESTSEASSTESAQSQPQQPDTAVRNTGKRKRQSQVTDYYPSKKSRVEKDSC